MKDRITAALLLTLLFLLSLAAWLKAPDALSQAERRRLAQPPALTLSALASGGFARQADAAAPDQFPLREPFRRLAALSRLKLFMQRDTNGVALHDGSLYKAEYPLKPASVQKAADWIKNVSDALPADAHAYYAIIPDKNAYLGEGIVPRLDYAALADILRETLRGCAEEISLADRLDADAYYKTDIHWRQERLSLAADRLFAGMGRCARFADTAYDQSAYEPFTGVLYGQAALPLPSETLYTLASRYTNAATVWNLETGKTRPVYEAADFENVDPYDVYLSGASAFLVVTNPLAQSDAELVVFRDSFGSSLVPLLLPAYSKITLVDPRYFASALLGDYIEWKNQDVLFLFSTLVLNSGELFK